MHYGALVSNKAHTIHDWVAHGELDPLLEWNSHHVQPILLSMGFDSKSNFGSWWCLRLGWSTLLAMCLGSIRLMVLLGVQIGALIVA